MMKRILWLCIGLCVLSTNTIFAQNFDCATVSEIPQTECEALVDLYNSTDGPNWYWETGWLQDNTPCTWGGLSCMEGHVDYLALPRSGLKGILPSTLGQLLHLNTIHLFQNQLTGPLPKELGNLVHLKTLWLSGNGLTGSIPKELGQLQSLRSLWLGGNHLTGPIPKELGNLAHLEYLELDWNDLAGLIPKELGQLTKLRRFGAVDNQLKGPIPRELGNLARLEYLLLGMNRLTGRIPLALVSLEHLGHLHLQDNNLEGGISPELSKLKELTFLNLANNNLVGAIPAELGQLQNLRYLYLNDNHLRGPIPLKLTKVRSLETFYFDGTDLCEPSDEAFQDWLADRIDVRSTGLACTMITHTEDGVLPEQITLSQNYPNPFNPTTRITFALPTSERVRLTVYDMLGREVAVLVDEQRPAGAHIVTFDGGHLPSGTYLYTLQAGDFTQTKTLVLMK